MAVSNTSLMRQYEILQAILQEHQSPVLGEKPTRQQGKRLEQRQKMREDALDAWADYQTTGLHVAAEEADAWLAELESSKDTNTPACHA
ncbi:MAG: hypothetical protein AB7F74_20950 [Parvibaculaceae bacterium]